MVVEQINRLLQVLGCTEASLEPRRYLGLEQASNDSELGPGPGQELASTEASPTLVQGLKPHGMECSGFALELQLELVQEQEYTEAELEPGQRQEQKCTEAELEPNQMQQCTGAALDFVLGRD